MASRSTGRGSPPAPPASAKVVCVDDAALDGGLLHPGFIADFGERAAVASR